jgi:hypothetical protein
MDVFCDLFLREIIVATSSFLLGAVKFPAVMILYKSCANKCHHVDKYRHFHFFCAFFFFFSGIVVAKKSQWHLPHHHTVETDCSSSSMLQRFFFFFFFSEQCCLRCRCRPCCHCRDVKIAKTFVPGSSDDTVEKSCRAIT